MDMIYLLTWLGSLVSFGLIYYLTTLWFKHSDAKETTVTTLTVEPDQITAPPPASKMPPHRGWRAPRGRMDREPFYVCMMWTLFIGGLIMLLGGPIHPSTIDAMHEPMQRMVAILLCFGTGTCIVGFLSGSRRFRPDADLRECYRMAVIATPANVSTLAVYAAAVGNTYHWNLRLFGLGAGGIVAVLIAHLAMAWSLYWEVRRLDARVAEALRAATEKANE